MKKASKLIASILGILGIPLLAESGVVITSNFVGRPSFPNTTSIADSPDNTSRAIPCFPFEDPGCCIDYAVCECTNGWYYPCPFLISATTYVFPGTFFATNKQYGATSLCNPPGSVVYGNGVGSIPGSCC
ncbi:hypothetical protein F5B21DRAFT_487985 [Xylaria acuta]|nr:hypothetical protein F5B21DRAFT_487985 [Xylaria acuta]